MDRAHYFSAALVALVAFVATVFFRDLVPSTLRGFAGVVQSLVVVLNFILGVKCTVWRYRDAGVSAWWLLAQVALVLAGTMAIAVAGLFAVVTLFGATSDNGLIVTLLLLGAGLSVGAAAWIFVWCLRPSACAASDDDGALDIVE